MAEESGTAAEITGYGDFSNGLEQRPLSEREKVDINKNNFNSVLVKFNPSVNIAVRNTLAGIAAKKISGLLLKI